MGHTNRQPVFAAVVMLVAFSSNTYSAERINLANHFSKLGATQLSKSNLTAQNSSSSNELTLEQDIINSIGLSSDNNLKLISSHYDAVSGQTINRYQQTYQGIPIWGESIVATTSNQRNITALQGVAIQNLDQSISNVEADGSEIDPNTALEMQKQQHEAENPGIPADQWQYENEKSDLVLYVDENGNSLKAYAVTFYADTQIGGVPTRPIILINALDGQRIDTFNGLTNIKAGTGPGGNAKTGRYTYGIDFDKLDVSIDGNTYTLENANVKTIDLNHNSTHSNGFTYTGPENTHKEINDSYSPLNDAHFFGSTVYDMYQNWFGIAPLSHQLELRVHYSTGYENSFWNGSAMIFGDGGNSFYSMVSLDIVAHEISHGFTEQNSNLKYQGQSAGINEAFSDIAGEAAEYYLHGSNDWIIGANVKKGSGGLRYLDNPSADGQSIDHVNQYTDSLSAHQSSGIFSKAFYLLATTNGWNTKKAFELFVRANRFYWVQNTDFNSGAEGICNAANDLAYNQGDVRVAFEAVGIPAANCTGDPNQAPVSNFSYSSNLQTIYFTDQSTDSDGNISSYVWDFGDGISSSLQDPAHTYNEPGTYNITLTVTDNEGATHTKDATITVEAANFAPCVGVNCFHYTGHLRYTNDWQAQPNGSYFTVTGGSRLLKGWLEGENGTDFDLKLMKHDGSRWVQVSISNSSSSSEYISYFAAPGQYYWRIYSYFGSGDYDLWMNLE